MELSLSTSRLRKAREACGLSVERAANLVGITRNSLANTENGQSEPRATTVARLAVLYGVELSSLFDHTADGTEPLDADAPANGGIAAPLGESAAA